MDVIRFTDPARGVYQKLGARGGRLAGAILLGDTRTAASQRVTWIRTRTSQRVASPLRVKLYPITRFSGPSSCLFAYL
jgi:NAD(P)H-nitrite reductase large subunit